MQLLIDSDQSILTVQQNFTGMFPYLKLEFFSWLHRSGRTVPLKPVMLDKLVLGQFKMTDTTSDIFITPSMTVSELERLFMTEYGLGVQVFRKSGRIWLETVLTASWSLEEQNMEGEQLGKDLNPEKLNPGSEAAE